MFFFFFDDVPELGRNQIIKRAFEVIVFRKFRAEGYCDINPVIGKPRIAKGEVEMYLKKIGSPLSILFQKSYPKDADELAEKLIPVLYEFENYMKEKENKIDEYNFFAIIFYIFQAYKTADEKLKCIKQYFERFHGLDIEYDIQITNGIVYNANKVNINLINSLPSYMNFIKGVRDDKKKMFYRGHSRVAYDLEPSLFRKNVWLDNERKMYLELISRCPFEFEKTNMHIEKLAKMQHYGLPTRLLDVTMNPLVALFFACENDDLYNGEVVLICEDKEKIKYANSDTVALLASLPLFSKSDQEDFYSAAGDDTFLQNLHKKSIKKLVHEVRIERPGFASEVITKDLRSIKICIPSGDNKRIYNQEGAFIVCGLVDEIYGDFEGSSISKLRLAGKDKKREICIIENKSSIRGELDNVGINKARIYPEIDDVADYIKTHVEEM